MALPKFDKNERKTAVYFSECPVQSFDIYKHAKNMTHFGGPLHGVSVVYVPSEMRAGEADKIKAEANDYRTQKTLVIAESPNVKLKRLMQRPKNETLEQVVGIKDMLTIRDVDLWSAQHDAVDELKIDQQVVAAAKKILGSKGLSTTLDDAVDTNQRAGDPDLIRTDWTTSVDHHGRDRPQSGKTGGGSFGGLGS